MRMIILQQMVIKNVSEVTYKGKKSYLGSTKKRQSWVFMGYNRENVII